MAVDLSVRKWLGLSLAITIAIASSACGEGRGEPCNVDRDCRRKLECLEGFCAPALSDPGGDDESRGGPVRVFAIGLRPLPEEAETQESFAASIRTLVDERVAPHLASDRPNLLVFPENAGLMATLIGERGANGRLAESAFDALLSINSTYREAREYYVDHFDVALGFGTQLLMGPTDTLHRSLELSFASLAAEHGVWVAVTYDVASAERVDDASLLPILADEGDRDRAYVHRAAEARVPNQTLLYAPDGTLHSSHEKEYLVPDEETLLGLSYGRLGNLGRARLPFGELGVVISKDAWMPDVLDRLALSGVNLLIQPEAFSGWTIPHGQDEVFSPDVVNEGGYAAVMKHAEFVANVLSCLSVNFFDMVFDCQNAVWVDPHLAPRLDSFVGQDPMPGFGVVAPWAIDDPGEGTLEERRAVLEAEGYELLPGGERENEYAHDAVYFDLDLGAPFPTRDDGSVALLAASSGAQRRPDAVLLADGTRYVAFEDGRGGTSRIYGMRLGPDGEVGEVRMRATSRGPARRPKLARAGDDVLLVFQDGAPGAQRIRFHRSTDGGRSFDGGKTLAEGEVWMPVVAAEGSRVTVAWIDANEGPGRVTLTESDDGGDHFDEAFELASVRGDPYDTRQNAWSPALARRGEATVLAWIDFRSFTWEVYGAVRASEEEPFQAPRRLDDAFEAFEPIHSDPHVLLTSEGDWLLAHTDLRVRREDYDPRVRFFSREGASEPSVSLAVTDASGRSQWRPVLAEHDGIVYAAFQDFRDGVNRIRVARSLDGGRTFADDVLAAPDAAADAFTPVFLPSASGPPALLFEATGTGRRQIAVAPLPSFP
jgi:predicted amidohydrolase